MKKIYVSPETLIYQDKTQLMLTASAEIDPTSSEDPEDADSRWFRFYEDEDE